MALSGVPSALKQRALQFSFSREIIRSLPPSPALPSNPRPKAAGFRVKPLVIQAKADPRTESAKIRNRRNRRKFTGTTTRPRLSVFCSDRQLYAMLVDDQNRKCLFYGSTLQKCMHDDPPCSTIEAAERVGEKLVQACIELNVTEISSYDRNGFARGERMQAFETAISRHGFLPR